MFLSEYKLVDGKVILPQEILKKIGYLRQHFVHFEGSLLGNKAGKSEGHKVECIIEINLESHNLVQNIPHKSTNDGPSTQRTILNANSRGTELPFLFTSLFIYFDNFFSQ